MNETYVDIKRNCVTHGASDAKCVFYILFSFFLFLCQWFKIHWNCSYLILLFRTPVQKVYCCCCCLWCSCSITMHWNIGHFNLLLLLFVIVSFLSNSAIVGKFSVNLSIGRKCIFYSCPNGNYHYFLKIALF